MNLFMSRREQRDDITIGASSSFHTLQGLSTPFDIDDIELLAKCSGIALSRIFY